MNYGAYVVIMNIKRVQFVFNLKKVQKKTAIIVNQIVNRNKTWCYRKRINLQVLMASVHQLLVDYFPMTLCLVMFYTSLTY